MDRAVHIEGDLLLDDWVVSGAVLPGEEPLEEAERQLHLSMRNQCLLARSYAEAGFVPVIDFVVPGANDLGVYRRELGNYRLLFAVLAPRGDVALERDAKRVGKTLAAHWLHLAEQMERELTDTGLWVDSSDLTVDETVDTILSRRTEAVLREMALRPETRGSDEE
jgi:hypothetical protein